MRIFATLVPAFLALCSFAEAASAQCFVENLPAPGQSEAYDARMRALMVAHAPIEYRKSCGLRDDSDRRYFEAVRSQVSCGDSAAYGQFFGAYLAENQNYVFAVRRTDLRTDEDFDRYCAIVERIDLSIAVAENGTVNPDALQAQAPLFHALRELVLTRRWQQ